MNKIFIGKRPKFPVPQNLPAEGNGRASQPCGGSRGRQADGR